MRLLFVTERYPPAIGGVAASAGRMAHAMAQLGHETHVFALTGELPAGRVESGRPAENLEVHQFGRSRNLDFTLQQNGRERKP